MNDKFKPPEDIKELTDLYYKNPGSEKLNSHAKYLNNPNNSFNGLNFSEEYVKEIFTTDSLIPEKIPEEKDKNTPDFKIEQINFFIEVKSINIAYGEKIDQNNTKINLKDECGWTEKINLTINDMEKKFEQLDGFFIGAVVPDAIYISLKNSDILWHEDFIRKTNFLKSKLNALFIGHRGIEGNVENKTPLIYVKDKSFQKTLKDSYENKFKIKLIENSLPT
ncbi:hypothetical protein COU62_00040 [Candidatus Pacearchaeota archaeon CG10_big_fil_rev_8_21_14_0_10_35_219]|nr:hypothetical protein [Candidatus Pacearchaeota archaeon]OIO43363.1 MAG: hypothetical protein AUJ63_00525 [Candidatus Pacearchaeota archaeon CG1_02_35_32]PIO08531.1 MAG: hypothetical protein COU62_00040 [Candidatus Pacearchaeota archaeon CG10_big_fil_rev_8_21_14_0_10_35_219]PIY81512.1 MAG: hypothetical protein COY79_02105 [Candidatus Pacearchaeota archaeon CG_4_10_14_0_8_um_filter_35_169]PIZ80402.1 MAG: hypothetical protein COY00_01010 [Candidatus Pacearchaeota archaeon CG_4_10_14_0_2_um_filt